MREKFELDAKEQIQRKILNILIVCIVLIIAKGIYNQSNNINQDDILTPVFLSLCVIFCTIYSFNAFTSGNIVKNWSSLLIFSTIFNRIKNKSLMSDEKAIKITTKIFGVFTLILAVVSIVIGIHSFYTGHW